MIEAKHIRAARALLRMKQGELAAASGVSLGCIKNVEREKVQPLASTMAALIGALTERGIDFIDGDDGVFVGKVI